MMVGTQAFALSDMSELLKSKESLFAKTSKTFMTTDKRGQFYWLTTEKKGARYSDERARKKLTLFKLKVWEVVVDFKDDRINKFNVSLFNRGDAGGMGKDRFEALVDATRKGVDGWVGGKGKAARRQTLSSRKGYTYSHSWKHGAYAVSMEWGVSDYTEGRKRTFRAEYLRLIMLPNDGKKNYGQVLTNTKTTASKRKLRDNVVKRDNGDVFIGKIPMVDQGQKGYCAVCVTSRVLKYYGSDVGQDTIAQMAEASAATGTNNAKLVENLKKNGGRLGVTVRNYKVWAYKDFLRMLKNYNRIAKKAKKPQFGDRDVAGFYAKADPVVLKETKIVRMRGDYARFLTNVKTNIKQGVPIVWGVTLGIYPEKERNRQSRGGHLRMIIGYNDKEKTIIFSDTWGARHVFKTMSAEDAWSMTNSYSVFLPRKI